MPYSLSRLKSTDYAKAKLVFDQASAIRKAYGAKGWTLFRNADDPNEVIILIEWDNLETARKFIQSEDVKKALKEAGTTESDFYFLNEVEKVKA
jgi:heme-degrading monooxygenase HmoA